MARDPKTNGLIELKTVPGSGGFSINGRIYQRGEYGYTYGGDLFTIKEIDTNLPIARDLWQNFVNEFGLPYPDRASFITDLEDILYLQKV